MAVSLRTVRPVNSETSATNIATPALGPSFGMAPAGTWMCTSDFSNRPGVDAELRRARLHQGERRLRAFLHHVAELAGEDEPVAAGNARRFDEQNIAAGRRPGEPGRNARHAGAHGDFVLETRRAEDRRQRRAVDAQALDAALRDAHRDMAADRADMALEIAHAGLARVVANDRADGVFGDLALLGLEAVGLELALDQIALRDFELLVLGVAGQLDHFHAVAHRSRNSVEHIGGADEHHLREIEGDGEIVVAKRRVLLGIEHFEQRR